MTKCNKCNQSAIILTRYSGAHLCENHFNRFIWERVKREIRKQCNIGKGEKIVVALSGGKDSTVSLHMLYTIFGNRPGITIEAITVDEGIKGYREKSIASARKSCRDLGITHHVISFSEFYRLTLDSVSKLNWDDGSFAPCTYCGVLRRASINRKAREIQATRLATGLNLDDTAQSAIMNFCRGDIDKFARMGPHENIIGGLIPRIQPLRFVPELEVYLFATINNIQFDHSECPYASGASRNNFRSIIAELEQHTPGTRHAIIRASDRISESIHNVSPTIILKKCPSCGEPTGQRVCKACILLEEIKAKK